MGNRFDFSVVADDEIFAKNQIQFAVAEVERIEQLLSTYRPDSITNLVNQQAGIKPVKVPVEFIQLIIRSKRISDLTQGAFDISYGSVDDKLWNFDKTMTELPAAEQALAAVSLINYQNIDLNPDDSTVFLRSKGMKIGFGGIGKGYAAERVKSLWIQNGVESGVINAAGDLATFGTQPNGKPWNIGVADPDQAEKAFSKLAISGLAVATSGNYEKYVSINDKRYSHTIDPRTGLPAHGIKSVTIVCPNAELADALATPMIVMGLQAGIEMINQMKGIACIIIDDDNKLYTSKNIKLT